MSLDARIASLIAFSQSRADAPAPPKDRITGSDENAEGSAKNKSGDISLDESTISALKKKVEEHNAAMRERKRPEWTHVRLPSLKAVYRRGAGAFSTSHRPGMTRDRWAMARVNAFLTLARRGRPENSKYVGDNDLLHSDHPRHSNQSRAMGTGTNAGGGALAGASDCGRDEDGKFGAGNTCGIGININDKHQDFTGLILAGQKTSETRITDSLKPYVGKTVGIVRTGKGPATLVGTMKIGKPKFYKKQDDFDADFDKHQVGPDSPHYIGPEGKYGYPLSEVKPVKPVVLKTKGIIGRVIHKSSRDMTIIYGLVDGEGRAFCPTGEGGGIDNSCGGASSGATPHGKWDIKKEPKEPSNPNRLATTHVVRLTGDDGKVKAYIDVQMGGDGETLYVDYGHVGEPYRGQGVYKDLLDSLSEQYTVVSDEVHNVATPVRKAYEELGARVNQYGSYELKKKSKRSFTSPDARYASLLAFAEARGCGRDPDGKFSSGNTCAGGAIVEAAKGAATGAVKGAITGLLAGGPATVKPGAAIGAATGAVKGLYDNQMRPTRVKRTIEKLGMTSDQVGSLVERLGGTPNSSADTKGNSLRITIRDKEGKKSFHVEIGKKNITVYPRRASGELSSKEISRVKKIADESTPKSVAIVVKKSSSAYVAKLVKSGFTLAAGHAADILMATYATPLVHSAVVDAAQSVKKRVSFRGFCPTGEGGGIDNSCSSQDGDFAASSAGATKTYSKAAEIEGPTKFNSQEIAKEIACDRFDEDKKLQRWADGSRSMRSDVSAHVASVRLASQAVPEIGDAKINFISRTDATRAGMLRGVSPKEAGGILGLTNTGTGEIRMIIDNPPTPKLMRKAFEDQQLSTDHPSHGIVHEFAHHLQVSGYRQFLIEDIKSVIADGNHSQSQKTHMENLVDHLEGGGEIPPEAVEEGEKALMAKFADFALADKDVRPWAIELHRQMADKGNQDSKKRLADLERGHDLDMNELQAYEIASNFWSQGLKPQPGVVMPPPLPGSFVARVRGVSKYATTQPIELTAEYWTAVTLGYRKRDPDLDAMCIAAHMPVPKERKGKAKK